MRTYMSKIKRRGKTGMTRKLFCMVLAVLLVLPLLPAVGMAQSDGAIAGLEQYLVNSAALPDDGYLGVPVRINTYAKGETNAQTQTIFYIINHAMERVGTEADLPILADFLEDGYIVVTLDYLNSPRAVSPGIDWSIQKIRMEMDANGTNLGALAYRKGYNYVVPSGCRLARDVLYWSIRDHASVGTLDWIVNVWNTDFMKAKGEKLGLSPAKTIDDCTKPDGSPLDFDLRMDIIYPSKPDKTVPVAMLASSAETRIAVWSSMEKRSHMTGFLMRGYAGVVYDHEYVPMARDDHYGYFEPNFSLMKENGVKTHTAAVRRVRYLADQYGYSKDSIGVFGHSKSGYCMLLSDPAPERLPERQTYAGFADETYGPQPWLTYADGTPISSAVQACYTSASGEFLKKYVDKDMCPTMVACGTNDTDWNYFWPAVTEALDRNDVLHVALPMKGVGHEYIHGYNDDLDTDLYAAFFDFFDYNLKAGENIPPSIVYATPIDQTENVGTDTPVVVKFNAAVAQNQVENGVRVVEYPSGATVAGTWAAKDGGSKWTWTSSALKPGQEYHVVASADIADAKGVKVSHGFVHRFKTAPGMVVPAEQDAYLASDGAAGQNFGAEEAILVGKSAQQDNTIPHEKRGLLRFPADRYADASKMRLEFTVMNPAWQEVSVYGVKPGATWDEGTVTWNNAPKEDVLLGKIQVAGAKNYSLDVTDYINGLAGGAPQFLLKASHAVVDNPVTLAYDFDTIDSFRAGYPAGNVCYSPSYQYRLGGEPIGAELSGEQDHTTGGGRSLKFMRTHGYDRIKLFNTFKDSALTAEDAGRSFQIDFWAKADVEGQLYTGIMSAGGAATSSSFYGTSSAINVKPETWTRCTYSYTLDEKAVSDAEQAGMLTFSADGNMENVYIDDISVTELTSDVQIMSRENTTGNGFAPRLAYDPVNVAEVAAAQVGYTESGAEADTNFGTSLGLFVNGEEVSQATNGGNKKGYFKLDLSRVESAPERAELSLQVSSGTKQKLQVYGVEDAPHWSADTLTWHNAPANDRLGGLAQPDGVYGGGAIGEIDIHGAGTYTVDVSSYIKACKDAGKDSATFLVCASMQPGATVLQYQFDDMDVFQLCEWNAAANKVYNPAHYRSSGGGLAELSAAEFYTDSQAPQEAGKSVKISGPNGWERVQFYNTVTKDRDLNSTDVGRSFQITFMAKANKAGNLTMGMMSAVADGTLAKASEPIDTSWRPYTYAYTLSEEMTAGQFGLFSILTGGLSPTAQNPAEIYVDDFTVVETTGGDVTLSAQGGDLYELGYLFDDLTSFPFDYTSTVSWSNTGKYRCSGGTKNAELSTEYNHTTADGGKCLKFISTAGHGRLKFYNSFARGRDLDQSDLGKVFEVCYYARSNKGGTFTSGLMSVSENTAFQAQTQTLEAGADWKKITQQFVVDEEMIANQAFLYSIATSGMGPVSSTDEIFFYIDDFSIKELPGAANSACSLALQTGASSSTIGAAAQGWVADGTDAYAVQDNSSVVIGRAPYAQTMQNGVRRAYLKYQTGASENAQHVFLTFRVTECGTPQKIGVYAATDSGWQADTLTWNNAPSCTGEPIGEALLDGTGDCRVDVTDYVKANPNRVVTFVLAAEQAGTKHLLQLGFEEEPFQFASPDDYAAAGGFAGNVSISGDAAYAGAKSLKIDGITGAYQGIQLRNIVKNGRFTQSDLGRRFTVSCFVRAAGTEAPNLVLGMGKENEAQVYGAHFAGSLSADNWMPCSFSFEVTQEMIDQGANLLSLWQTADGPLAGTLYVDGLAVREEAGVVLEAESPAMQIITPFVPDKEPSYGKVDIKQPVVMGNKAVLRATVSSSFDRKADSVSFYNNGVKLEGNVKRDGYDYTMELSPINGAYSVTAKADFSNGETVESEAVTFQTAAAISKLTVSARGGGRIMATVEAQSQTDWATGITEDFARGTRFVLAAVADADSKFLYWIDQGSGRMVSQEAEYAFYLGTDRMLEAVFAKETPDVKTVIFHNKNGQVLLHGQVSAGSSVLVPQNPEYMGYQFTTWLRDGIEQKFVANDAITFDALASSHTMFCAGYAKMPAQHTVTVSGGSLAGGAPSGQFAYDSKITVALDPAAVPAGKKFSHWTKNGAIVSYAASYSFYMGVTDAEVRAVYVDETAQIVQKPVLVMSTPVLLDGGKIAFFSERNLAASCTMVETGILLCDSDSYFDTDTEGIIKATAISKANNGQYTIRKANVSPGETWYAKAYMLYRDAEGQLQYVFSERVEATYPAAE